MRFFLDTEFIENGYEHPLELLSIGIVSEDGRTYYAENAEADYSYAGQWVRENVIPLLLGPTKSRLEIKNDLLAFIGIPTRTIDAPEFWGYFADYDWVIFAQLFGSMVDLPTGWPMYCNDLKQLSASMGVRSGMFPTQTSKAHNALNDALWNQELFAFLTQKEK